MKKKSLAIITCVLVAVLVANVASHRYLRDARAVLQVTYKPPQTILPPAMIRMLAGEFKGLWANYMILEVGSFEGSNQPRTAEDYRNIYRGLQQSLALDPYFQQTYMLVQGILPWRAEMPREANELLDISRQHRSWDWRPGHYMGFNNYYFLDDYAKASEVLLETAKVKDAPVLLAVLGARFAQRSERTQAAIDILTNMLQDEDLPESYRLELSDRLMALKGARLIEMAIARYEAVNGSRPPSLLSLVAQGFLTALPANPYGEEFYYDFETGRVTFDNVDKKASI